MALSNIRTGACVAALVTLGLTGVAQAAPVFVGGPAPAEPTWANLIDFENRAEGELIGSQYLGQGVTFSQPDSGRPIIDNSPYLFGYGAGSGVGALTGSTEGGAGFPTLSGIIASFTSPVARAGAFFSDSAPLGNYTITAFGAGDVVLETYILTAATLDSANVGRCDSFFPQAEFQCGVFVGFDMGADLITRIQFGAGAVANDSFAIDNLRWEGSSVPVPEPGSLGLLGLGLAGLAAKRKHKHK